MVLSSFEFEATLDHILTIEATDEIELMDLHSALADRFFVVSKPNCFLPVPPAGASLERAAVPAPCQYDAPGMEMDTIGCERRPEAHYEFNGNEWVIVNDPTPERPIERPTREEYLVAFAEDVRFEIPDCVIDRWLAVDDRLEHIRATVKTMPHKMSRRVKDGLARYDESGMVGAYNVGLVARIEHYYQRSVRRAHRARRASRAR